MNQRDFLIVGGGLSGLSVAIHLIQAGQRVTVIDSGENASSTVAAGLINPIVFRRMAKSWRVDDFLPYAREFYRDLEVASGARFFHPVVIRRLFSHEQERDLWLKYQSETSHQNYLSPLSSDDDHYDKAINSFGSGRVQQAAYVDTTAFLSVCVSYIQRQGSYFQSPFCYDELMGTRFRGHTYSDIIFCEGYKIVDNPWFNYLPLIPTKGEVLTVNMKIPEEESINRKCFVLPLGNGLFRVGSTYVWHTQDHTPTAEGRQEILDNLGLICKSEAQVVDHVAGIRPATPDRRPFIGTHPSRSSYHLFNGLGAKGYLLAPYLSRDFVDVLINAKKLDPEVSITRFNPGKNA